MDVSVLRGHRLAWYGLMSCVWASSSQEIDLQFFCLVLFYSCVI